MRHTLRFIVLAAAVPLAGCSEGARHGSPPVGDTAAVGGNQDTVLAGSAGGNAAAAMRDSSGKDLGTLTLSESGQAIAVSGRLTGLPRGEHAIHVHTVGRCDAPKFESAGDHWNPTGKQHGKDTPGGPHLGDMPNFTVGQDGSVSVQATTPGGTLRGTNAALDSDGATVVIHAKRDDYKTQPSGDSGDRIACGVVR